MLRKKARWSVGAQGSEGKGKARHKSPNSSRGSGSYAGQPSMVATTPPIPTMTSRLNRSLDHDDNQSSKSTASARRLAQSSPGNNAFIRRQLGGLIRPTSAQEPLRSENEQITQAAGPDYPTSSVAKIRQDPEPPRSEIKKAGSKNDHVAIAKLIGMIVGRTEDGPAKGLREGQETKSERTRASSETQQDALDAGNVSPDGTPG